MSKKPKSYYFSIVFSHCFFWLITSPLIAQADQEFIPTLQAESQYWDRGTVDTNHSDYTGTGFLNTENRIGTNVYWSLWVPSAGFYDFSVRYAHGYENRTQAIHLNDQANFISLPFINTGNWENWQEQFFTLALSAGENQLRMESLTSGGAPNLDRMLVSQPVAVADLEAETQRWDLGTVDTDHEGYSGDGFLNTGNIIGTNVYWSFTLDEPGRYEFMVRYAHATESRPQAIYVNDQLAIDSVGFYATGGWSTWKNQPFQLDLSRGFNTIRFKSLTSGGAPNLDKMVVTRYLRCVSNSCVLPAEEQQTTNVRLENEIPGYTGVGYLILSGESQSSIDWGPDVPSAGETTLNIRYANNSSNCLVDLYVNDNLAQSGIAFANTGAAFNWAYQRLKLDLIRGYNKVIMQPQQSCDQLFVDLGEYGRYYPYSVSYPLVLQAENQRWDGGTLDSEHPGFEGTGYVNTANQLGISVFWNPIVSQTGNYLVTVRYAHGVQDRPQAIVVNGEIILPFVAFPSTGGWSNWQSESFIVPLKAGGNILQMKSLSQGGAPNLDQMSIQSAN